MAQTRDLELLALGMALYSKASAALVCTALERDNLVSREFREVLSALRQENPQDNLALKRWLSKYDLPDGMPIRDAVLQRVAAQGREALKRDKAARLYYGSKILSPEDFQALIQELADGQ